MCSLRTAILTAGFAMLSATAIAEPKAGPGYEIETFTMAGAIFAGLSRDGADLLVTDLAAGRLYRRRSDGKLTAFGPTFPHGRDVIGDPTGPYRVLQVNGAYVVAQGWTPVDAKEGSYDHALVAIENGEARVISNDFWNPFDFVVSDNTYFIVDAARNSVERLEFDGTHSETFYTFGRIDQAGSVLQTLSPTEFPGNSTYSADAVPTGIALHHGRIYVSLFGGFPFAAGAGKVVSITTDDEAKVPRIEIEGLNAPVDVAFDANGRFLVLEHGVYDQAVGFEPGTGRLFSFDVATGDRQVVLDGLTRPASILVWDERQLIVSDLDGNLHFLTRKMAN